MTRTPRRTEEERNRRYARKPRPIKKGNEPTKSKIPTREKAQASIRRRAKPKPRARVKDGSLKGTQEQARTQIPGVDYSGVHPETGKYTVVRGNHKGVNKNPKNNNPNYIRPKTPADRKRNVEICGAHRSGGDGLCCQPAGWGTSHVGYGTCRLHGGLTPAHTKFAEKQIAQERAAMFGLPVDIDPQRALLEEVQRSAGHVKWLGDYIAGFEDPSQMKQRTEQGQQPGVWNAMYLEERKHLAAVSKAAIQAGVAERQVRISEQMGQLFAQVIRAVLEDKTLQLTSAQKAIAPKIVRQHLTTLPLAAAPNDAEIVDAEVVDDEKVY